MTTVKVLAIAVLLIGGASVALAQSGPPSGGQPAVAGRPPAAPPASGPPGPGVNPAPKIEQSSAAPTGTASGTRIATRHHKKMYLSAKAAPAASLAYCQTEQQVKAPCACGPAKIACPPGMYCHAFGNACTP
jgi:hypothetical protein